MSNVQLAVAFKDPEQFCTAPRNQGFDHMSYSGGGAMCYADGGRQGQSACGSYCGAMLQACPDAFLNMAHCMKVCSLYPAECPSGGRGAVNTNCNALSCRMQQLNQVSGARCSAAGPSGGGVCGSVCEGYCNIMPQECKDEVDAASCVESCAVLPNYGEEQQWDTNTFQCRMTHATLAVHDSTYHCPKVRCY